MDNKLNWLNSERKSKLRLVICTVEHSLCPCEFVTHFSTEHGYHSDGYEKEKKRARIDRYRHHKLRGPL